MRKLGVQKGEAITHRWVTSAIEKAQRKVEGYYFDTRKQLLEYDNVANDQRRVIYDQRDALMRSEDISESMAAILSSATSALISEYIPPNSVEEMWHVAGLENALESELGLKLPLQEWLEKEEALEEETLRKRIAKAIKERHEEKTARIGEEMMRRLEKSIMLHALDTHWQDHLAQMEYLRQSIFLRGYAQKDPKQEYKREAFHLFTTMLESIKRQVVSVLSLVEVQAPSDVEAVEAKEAQRRLMSNRTLQFQHPTVVEEPPAPHQEVLETPEIAPVSRSEPKIGRNAACPCGSGKKYKYCHGQLV